MKNGIKLMMLVILALAFSNACAVFDPDTDSDLKFNLNFENNISSTTVDAEAGLTGTLEDYNTAGFDVFDENGIRNISGDFSTLNDLRTGAGDGNDCSFIINPDNTEVFEFGDGWPGSDQTTFTFWFNAPSTSSGTFFRQIYQYDTDGTWYWEVRIYNGKLGFYHGQNFIRFETTDTLTTLGVSASTWHHAAVVVDRTTRESSKMYIDGISVPVTVASYNTNSMAMDSFEDYYSPLEVGRGTREFEGLLDELRIYGRALNDLEVSLIYQNNPSVVHTIALLPVPKSVDVSITTDVNWIPATGATAQYVYFGTDSNMANLSVVKSGNGTFSEVTNTELGGSLNFNTTYYWYVKSTISGGDITSPLWSFTTGSQEATNIYPENGDEDIPDENIDLQWSATDAAGFDVYFSIHKDLVEANDASVCIATGITDSNFLIADTNKGETYYWKINSTYLPSTLTVGSVWQFRTEARPLIVNTSDVNVAYEDVDYPALSMTKDEDLLTTVTGYLGDDDVAIFDFATDPNFSGNYDMIIIPQIDSVLEAQYDAAGHRRTSRPMAMHVTGDFNLKFHIVASGPAAAAKQYDSSSARAGGHRGSYRTEDRSSMTEEDMLDIFGPGYGQTGATTTSPTLFCGAGGGYGGIGGDNGRAGTGSGGDTYGYSSIPVPLGGSAGGWSNNANGGPGGGAVEIAATGDVNIASTAKILVTGGSGPSVDYGSGGGAGGSVKIVAGGSVKCAAPINADGGKGSDTLRADKQTDAGGGGGGGRIAIYYASNSTIDSNLITVAGGEVGNCNGSPSTSSLPGENGTIFISNSNPLNPELTAPDDDSDTIILNDKVTLKWYPGFGATQNQLYFGTSSNPEELTLVKTISADSENGGVLRAQQSYDANVTSGQTYYWYIKTTNGTTEIDSDVWSFTAVNDFKLIFNTSDVNTITYDSQSIAPLTCRVKNATGWVTTPVATGSVAADGVSIFSFSSGFNYGQNYTIVVLPEYSLSYDSLSRRPLAIYVTGDFYFDGILDISGDDADGTNVPAARSGGHRGVRYGRGSNTDVSKGYYVSYTRSPWGEYRWGTDTSSRTFYTVASSAYSVFGQGLPNVATAMPTGGGGGYGGIGGDSGRGFWFGAFGGGATYGDKEIPSPVGGSSGGLSDTIASGAGGGGVEIVATGSVTFGANAQIHAEGGSVVTASGKGGGGGSGGSVRIITGTTFSNSGTISVNGGKGGDTNAQLNQIGGGGSGGRVSIYYGSGTPTIGTITADGGVAGTYNGTVGYAQAGQDGTIYVSSGSPKKASAPTPYDGNEVYAGTITLKWYPGYGAGSDEVYFGTDSANLTKVGSTVTATRGTQSSSTATVTITAGTTYYFKVVTDSTVTSDIWSFKAVDWQCVDPWYDTLVWDKGPYYNCFVDFEDFIDLANTWDDGIYTWAALRIFADEWLDDTRTP